MAKINPYTGFIKQLKEYEKQIFRQEYIYNIIIKNK